MIIPGRITILTILTAFFTAPAVWGQTGEKPLADKKTVIQSSEGWNPSVDVRTDAVLVYDLSLKDPGRFRRELQTWKDKGYHTCFMTNIAWGHYALDYFNGTWDGEEHWDEIQTDSDGNHYWNKKYYVPSLNYLLFKKQVLKKAIDAGVEAVFIEEPEFFATVGYSEGFKREWRAYYGTPWQAVDSSPEATFLSNKLKYHLYYRALDECFKFCKEYGKTLGKDIKCFVPTHTLINYAQWGIVSPEASLASLESVDGYIAQVWTGTSREPQYYNGIKKERTFENAFLEYGCMESMTAPTGGTVWFLTDPVEDRRRDWADYKKNYEATFTAQLLYPRNNHYETMPWPHRIYQRKYARSATDDTMENIPEFYSTQLQVMTNALNSIPLSDNKVSGSQGIGVLLSNSLMFQRATSWSEEPGDPALSGFYGMSLPLLKRGVPVQMMHIENVRYPESWKDISILIMTYSNMKPLEEDAHGFIADWVKDGGALLYCGRDDDPFQDINEWWKRLGFSRPADHLFSLMGIPAAAPEGDYRFGKGLVRILRRNPKEFVLSPDSDGPVINAVQDLWKTECGQGDLMLKNSLYLERGFYDIAGVMDESVSDKPLTIKGTLIDLYDPSLPVLKEKVIHPGEYAFLIDVDRVEDPSVPQVLATGGRVYDEETTARSYSFLVKGPLDTKCAMRVLLPRKPGKIALTGSDGNPVTDFTWTWDRGSRTLFLKFPNSHDGVKADISL